MDATYFLPNETDEFLVSQYKDFLPKKIFDAHMHMPLGVTIPASQGTGVYFREAFTPEDYWNDLGHLFPGVESFRLNMMPHPADRIQRHRENGLRDLGNDHVFQLRETHRSHVVSPFILPTDDRNLMDDFITTVIAMIELGIHGNPCKWRAGNHDGFSIFV